MESKKWYGLTIPKKVAKVSTKGKSVFESDDSDENAVDCTKIKKEPACPPKEKKKKATEPKPTEIDSNIYEYDSIYDEMKASQKPKASQAKMKEPRYINLLLKAAEKRKKEGERRVERKIQAERVKEGDAFKDKEAFVTSAYRQKMIEMEEEEEREQRENVLEEMMDSTKQKDLSGFYRHFLKQTVGEEKIPEFGERDAKMSGTSKKKQDHPETDHGRQKSESPCRSRVPKRYSSPDNKDDCSDTKQETEKPHKSDVKHSSHSEFHQSGHSKGKTSSHRSRSRLRSNSPSDSEDKKNKHNRDKSHKNKSDLSSYSSKHVRDDKPKKSCSSRNQEEKVHDRDRTGHSKSAVKQMSSSEKHSGAQSPSKTVDLYVERSKHNKESEHKKDTRTRGKMGKRSLQISPKPSTSNDLSSYDSDKRSSSSKSLADYAVKSGHSSDDDTVSTIKKLSGNPSKKRESGSSDEYSENKRRKYQDDGDTSNSSSEEDEVNAKNSQKEGNKDAPEKAKYDIVTKFAKRTVGKIFDDAQARYFKRRDAAKAMG